jgi:hypothetical protein
MLAAGTCLVVNVQAADRRGGVLARRAAAGGLLNEPKSRSFVLLNPFHLQLNTTSFLGRAHAIRSQPHEAAPMMEHWARRDCGRSRRDGAQMAKEI